MEAVNFVLCFLLVHGDPILATTKIWRNFVKIDVTSGRINVEALCWHLPVFLHVSDSMEVFDFFVPV